MSSIFNFFASLLLHIYYLLSHAGTAAFCAWTLEFSYYLSYEGFYRELTCGLCYLMIGQFFDGLWFCWNLIGWWWNFGTGLVALTSTLIGGILELLQLPRSLLSDWIKYAHGLNFGLIPLDVLGLDHLLFFNRYFSLLLLFVLSIDTQDYFDYFSFKAYFMCSFSHDLYFFSHAYFLISKV